MRPQRVEHEQAMAGRELGEPPGRSLEAFSGPAVQEGAIERAVQVAADEVAHARVAKVDRDAGQARQAAKLRMREDVFAADGHDAMRGGTARRAPDQKRPSKPSENAPCIWNSGVEVARSLV